MINKKGYKRAERAEFEKINIFYFFGILIVENVTVVNKKITR